MPEKVHLKFDDLGSVENPKTDPTRNGTEVRVQGKKRKREDHKSDARQRSHHDGQRAYDEKNGNSQTHSIEKSTSGSDVVKSGRDFLGHERDTEHKHAKTPKKSHISNAQSGQLRAKAKALEAGRKSLPIWSHTGEIKQFLREKNVLLLVGETGSGKSTQVPQMLIDEPWCKLQRVRIRHEGREEGPEIKVGGCIAITQPRRVAAISLARRVAQEMGTPLGSSSPASKVGYSVRFDNSTSPAARIKYLTEGMLLQEMLRDPYLTQYSAVIVDEIHERGVNVDLVTGFLKNLSQGNNEGRGGIPLKVVIMSATADMESLMTYFGGDLDARSNGSSSIQKIKDVKIKKPATQGPSPDGDPMNTANSNESGIVAKCYIEGRQYPVKVIYTPHPVPDFVDAALQTIFKIHYKEPLPGDVLVFLTGQDTVEDLQLLVEEQALSMAKEVPKLIVLPLFAALPQQLQQRVFEPAPHRTRKIILSTNIAETSVTVPGVRYVIDCGKAKVKQFRTRLGLESLLVKPISKSSAIQRKGRAGREAPGDCYRLYTGNDYDNLEEANTPEILRCDLSQALLVMKARGVQDIINFPFLDRPPRESLEKALLELLQLGALTESGEISDIGAKIARLPLTARLGRVLLAAAEAQMDCLPEAIDIISCLSVENMFLNVASEEKREQMESSRKKLYRREGDHLTLLNTVRAYAAENSDRKAWADRHYVSHRAMQSVMDVRKQLYSQCHSLKLLTPSKPPSETSSVSPDTANLIVRSFLRGFATSTARICPDGSYKTVIGNQTVAIHPSSVLFGRKVEAIMYNEFVYTNKTYARGVSAVQMDWIGEALAGVTGGP